jgi:hypothetical protein
MKINFKNCVLVTGRHMQLLLFDTIHRNQWLPQIITSIARIRQKVRPNRSYPRQSFKPRNKWQANIRVGAINA